MSIYYVCKIAACVYTNLIKISCLLGSVYYATYVA